MRSLQMLDTNFIHAQQRSGYTRGSTTFMERSVTSRINLGDLAGRCRRRRRPRAASSISHRMWRQRGSTVAGGGSTAAGNNAGEARALLSRIVRARGGFSPAGVDPRCRLPSPACRRAVHMNVGSQLCRGPRVQGGGGEGCGGSWMARPAGDVRSPPPAGLRQ